MPAPTSTRETLTDAMAHFTARCRARNLSPRTLDYYRYRLTAFARYLEDAGQPPALHDITPETVRGFLTAEARKSATTAHHSLLTLRTFFKYLCNNGLLPTSPCDRVESIRRQQPVLPTFSDEQVEAMLGTCGVDFIGLRDRALFLVLLDCGLRISEVCGLTLQDVRAAERVLLVRGKGGKERLVPYGDTAQQVLTAYVSRRGDLPHPTVFVSTLGDPLSRRSALDIIRRRGTAAHVQGVRCSPHTFRHTFAVMYLRNGGDVFTLQKLLGHTDLTMTRRYAELSQTDVIDRHRQCSPGDRFAMAARPKTGRRRMK